VTQPIASGRDADVHAAGDGLVARTYRDGRPARREAELIAALHARGYPVPRVESYDGPTIVMERVDGPTLGELLLTGDLPAADGVALWVDLQERLHALDWEGGSLLHLDFHPFNVLLGADGPVVIDWSNAEVGEPGLDVALSALMTAGAALAPDAGVDPGAARALLAAYAGAVRTPYVEHLADAATYRATRMLPTPGEVAVMDEAVALARSVGR
jgi:aminoglycoside phosphotransferase (APT) family kinase protein